MYFKENKSHSLPKCKFAKQRPENIYYTIRNLNIINSNSFKMLYIPFQYYKEKRLSIFHFTTFSNLIIPKSKIWLQGCIIQVFLTLLTS